MRPSLGSGGSIRALAAGAIDLALTSRPVKPEDRASELTVAEYARTPFVFAVSTKAQVGELTVAEIAAIYAGTRQQWPSGDPVRVVLRPVSDIDTELVKQMAPELKNAVEAAERRPGIAFAVTDQEAADTIERVPGAIGPTTLGLILSEKRSLRALKIDGIAPTVANMRNASYPHYKRLYVLTGPTSTPSANDLARFLRSEESRNLLRANGFWAE